MRLRTHFVVYATLLIAATLPLSAEVAYISDCCNNSSVVGVFQTSTYKQKAQWTAGKNAAGIFEVDVTTHKLVKMIPAGQAPGSLAITPDASQLWATDLRATSASMIDVATGAVIKEIPLRNQSYGIAFGPE